MTRSQAELVPRKVFAQTSEDTTTTKSQTLSKEEKKKSQTPDKKFCQTCGAAMVYLRAPNLGLLKYICPECSKTAQKEYEKEKEIKNYKKSRSCVSRLFHTSEIPERFRKSAITNFKHRDIKKLIEVKKDIEKHIDIMPTIWPGGMIFVGPPGCGKTHLGVSILRGAIENKYSGRYVTATKLSHEVKAWWKKEKSSDNPFKEWSHYRILFIDELEKIKSSPKSRDIVDELIDERWSKKNTTVIATNQKFKDLVKFLGVPAIDRLNGSENLFTFSEDTPSYRTGVKLSELQKTIKEG